MEVGGKDRPPMLAPCSSKTTTEGYIENYKNVSQDIRNQLNVEAEAVQIILTGIDNDIYSTVDACPNACKMWKAIERGKAIVNSPPQTYDQEPKMVAEDDALSNEKEIDKLMDLISISLKKIYKPTNNNLRTSSNTSRAKARENVGTQVVQQSGIQYYNCKEYGHVARECQKPKRAKDAAYHKEKMLLYATDNSEPIFDAKPLQKEQGDTNITIDSLDMCTNGEIVNQDDDDIAKERHLLASLIEKLKCEINKNKNHDKFLESSNKTLVDILKGEIKDFKTKNKSLESSNNHFKEANNKQSKKNQLMLKDLKKFQDELDKRHDVNYMLKVELDCAKAKMELMSYKTESQK
nr:hypothetical protein [Tanacetum cinerariifolium]